MRLFQRNIGKCGFYESTVVTDNRNKYVLWRWLGMCRCSRAGRTGRERQGRWRWRWRLERRGNSGKGRRDMKGKIMGRLLVFVLIQCWYNRGRRQKRSVRVTSLRCVIVRRRGRRIWLVHRMPMNSKIQLQVFDGWKTRHWDWHGHWIIRSILHYLLDLTGIG